MQSSGDRRGWLLSAILMAVVMLGLAVAAGAIWFALAPRVRGTLVGETVSYPGADAAPAVVAAVFLVVTGVAGFVVGVFALGVGSRRYVARTVGLTLAGLPASALAYAVGSALGPPAVAAQVAAGAQTVQVPLTLPSPALVLLWPAVTALLVTVGTLISMMVTPPAPEPVSDTYVGAVPTGQGEQIPGSDFDVEPAPPGTDQNGRP